MRTHDQDRHRDHRFDGDTDRGQPHHRYGDDNERRGRHAPYKRKSRRDWTDWVEQSDDDID